MWQHQTLQAGSTFFELITRKKKKKLLSEKFKTKYKIVEKKKKKHFDNSDLLGPKAMYHSTITSLSLLHSQPEKQKNTKQGKLWSNRVANFIKKEQKFPFRNPKVPEEHFYNTDLLGPKAYCTKRNAKPQCTTQLLLPLPLLHSQRQKIRSFS